MSKIPENAKCVFKGKLFDVWQWPQEMFDGTTRTFEMLSRKPTVDMIAIEGEKILMLMQEQPNKPLFPSFPGGGIDGDETPLEAAKRELKEETGYEAKEWNVYKTWTGYSKLYFPETLFIARGLTRVAEPELDGGERMTIHWVTFDGLLEHARNRQFTTSLDFRFELYEAMLDPKKKEELRKTIFGI